jgi:hypothetical protein
MTADDLVYSSGKSDGATLPTIFKRIRGMVSVGLSWAIVLCGAATSLGHFNPGINA